NASPDDERRSPRYADGGTLASLTTLLSFLLSIRQLIRRACQIRQRRADVYRARKHAPGFSSHRQGPRRLVGAGGAGYQHLSRFGGSDRRLRKGDVARRSCYSRPAFAALISHSLPAAAAARARSPDRADADGLGDQVLGCVRKAILAGARYERLAVHGYSAQLVHVGGEPARRQARIPRRFYSRPPRPSLERPADGGTKENGR